MKNNLFFLLLVTISVFFVSCFKNVTDPDLKDIGSQKIFELAPIINDGLTYKALPIDTLRDLYSFVRDSSVQTLKIPVIITASESGNFSSDVTLYLEKDTAALRVLNYKLHKTNPSQNYVLLPDSMDVTPKPYSVTIPAGQNMGYFTIKVKPLSIRKDSVYKSQFIDVVAYKISKVPSGSIISNGRSSVVYPVSADKNKYDGKYSIRGYILRSGDPAKTGVINPFTRGLVTIDSVTTKFDDLQLWADGAKVAIGNPIIKVNPDNSVDVSSDGTTVAYNAPGFNSKYDPSTRNFYIYFTWGAGPTSRLCKDTLTYIGPR